MCYCSAPRTRVIDLIALFRGMHMYWIRLRYDFVAQGPERSMHRTSEMIDYITAYRWNHS